MDAAATGGEGCPRQIEIARESGADLVIVFKHGVRHNLVDDLRSRKGLPLFKNDRLMVLSL